MSAITPISEPPNFEDDDWQDFQDKADASLGEFPRLIAEINALEAGLRAAAQPLGMPYMFSAATADADPTPGYIRVSNAAFVVGAAIVLRTDLVDELGVTRTPQLEGMAASTNPLKSLVRIQAPGDATRFVDLAITAMASPAGYRNFTGTVVAASSATPFAANDNVVLLYVRTGDKGDKGDFASWTLANTLTVSGSPTQLTFSSLLALSAGYSDLAFDFEVSGFSTNVGEPLTMAVSADGSNFSGLVQLQNDSPNGWRGQVLLLGFRRDYQFALSAIMAASIGSPGAAAIASPQHGAFRSTGGVSAVRFFANTRSFNNGSVVKLWAK